MRRQTPLIALILAPFVLWAVVMMWDRVLLPLTVKMWRSEFAVRARLASGDAGARSKALRDAAAAREPDAAVGAVLVGAARRGGGGDAGRVGAQRSRPGGARCGAERPGQRRPPPSFAGRRHAGACEYGAHRAGGCPSVRLRRGSG